eukprot:scaffold90183_cov22-Cyclotella_meneghiniana.AAC.2
MKLSKTEGEGVHGPTDAGGCGEGFYICRRVSVSSPSSSLVIGGGVSKSCAVPSSRPLTAGASLATCKYYLRSSCMRRLAPGAAIKLRWSDVSCR